MEWMHPTVGHKPVLNSHLKKVDTHSLFLSLYISLYFIQLSHRLFTNIFYYELILQTHSFPFPSHFSKNKLKVNSARETCLLFIKVIQQFLPAGFPWAMWTLQYSHLAISTGLANTVSRQYPYFFSWSSRASSCSWIRPGFWIDRRGLGMGV